MTEGSYKFVSCKFQVNVNNNNNNNNKIVNAQQFVNNTQDNPKSVKSVSFFRRFVLTLSKYFEFTSLV